jgi:SAM-dependent methyltransferase
VTARAGHHGRVTDEDGYLLDNADRAAGRRFAAMSTLFDPWTFRHVADVGIAPGWHCWEVGAGGSSVPTWLAAQVGPTGRVLATDIDVSHLDSAAGAYEVRRHDIGIDPPPDAEFDLVHTRLVLVHVEQRTQALQSLVSCVRPGGWLLAEDADPELQPLLCPDEHGPEQRLANRLRRGFRTLLAQRGAELGYGRTLPRLLRAAGLVDVQADAYFPVASPACTDLERATVEQIRDRLVRGGIATDAELDEHLRNVATGTMDLATAPLISAWGRRPPR